jgi:hypothetical protein
MTVDQVTERKLNKLRSWNIVIGLVLAVQAVLMAVLTNNFSIPVTATFLQGMPGTPSTLQTIWSIQTGWGVFTFMAISAAALLLIASPWVFQWYKRNLLQNRNYGRWIEYFFSSSIMITLIAQICGITDVAALMAIFGINATMILFGGIQEKYEQPGKPSWIPFWYGSFAGIIPWIAIVVYMVSPGVSASPPGFVYGIIVSYFVFFNSFAVNMVLQYKQVGHWKDYLFGEKVYIILSLSAKSLLAWLVFANILVQ